MMADVTVVLKVEWRVDWMDPLKVEKSVQSMGAMMVDTMVD
jgi:hypothetical protein